MSLYPQEKEILLPPLSVLRVRENTPPTSKKPGHIVCDFVKCLMTERLQEAVERDLHASTQKLRAFVQKQPRRDASLGRHRTPSRRRTRIYWEAESVTQAKRVQEEFCRAGGY